jgi:hypothetical protein
MAGNLRPGPSRAPAWDGLLALPGLVAIRQEIMISREWPFPHKVWREARWLGSSTEIREGNERCG